MRTHPQTHGKPKKPRGSVLWPLILVAQMKDSLVDFILLPEQGRTTALET